MSRGPGDSGRLHCSHLRFGCPCSGGGPYEERLARIGRGKPRSDIPCLRRNIVAADEQHIAVTGQGCAGGLRLLAVVTAVERGECRRNAGSEQRHQ